MVCFLLIRSYINFTNMPIYNIDVFTDISPGMLLHINIPLPCTLYLITYSILIYIVDVWECCNNNLLCRYVYGLYPMQQPL